MEIKNRNNNNKINNTNNNGESNANWEKKGKTFFTGKNITKWLQNIDLRQKIDFPLYPQFISSKPKLFALPLKYNSNSEEKQDKL